MKAVRILKGWHYSLCLPKIFIGGKSSFAISTNASFTDSCKYDIDEPSCVNKLFGFVSGIFGVHMFSHRFGWAYNSVMDNITIYAYTYNEGKLKKVAISSVECEQIHSYKIRVTKLASVDGPIMRCEFIIDDEIKHVTETNDGWSFGCLHLGLTPYFGGNTRAPHEVIIMMDKISVADK